MEVFYICNSLSGGGAEKLLNDMLPTMVAKDGLECELLLVTDKNAKYLQKCCLPALTCCYVLEPDEPRTFAGVGPFSGKTGKRGRKKGETMVTMT